MLTAAHLQYPEHERNPNAHQQKKYIKKKSGIIYTVQYYSPFERQIYDITNVESKKMVQMILFIRQNQTHQRRKQTYNYQRGNRYGRRIN